jgi:hypothetical protein
MQFHIERDAGQLIVGWVVLDNPATIPRIVISSPGERDVEMQANVLRTDLKNLGLHSTGMAGFLIDEQAFPRLGKLSSVEIREASSRVILFRRFQPTFIERKLCRFDTQVMPQTSLDSLLAARFALPYHSVEQYSFDTLFGLINNMFCGSIYISGRPLFRRYAQLLRDRGFTVVTMLRDPYEELAERLLFIQYVSRQQGDTAFSKRLTGLSVLAEIVADLDFADETAMAKRFGSVNESQRRAIANPFVRLLGCDIDEEPEQKHVMIALENLASMDLVGLRSHSGEFQSILDNLLGAEIVGGQPLVEVSWVPIIADSLARIESVNRLLELDLALYDYVKEAVESAIGQPAEPEPVRRPVSRSWLSSLFGRQRRAATQ